MGKVSDYLKIIKHFSSEALILKKAFGCALIKREVVYKPSF